MRTPSDFRRSQLSPMNSDDTEPSFGSSALRHLLFAIAETSKAEGDAEVGRQYLRDAFITPALYWSRRDSLITLLDWLAALGNVEGMKEWQADAEAARILAGRLRVDEA